MDGDAVHSCSKQKIIRFVCIAAALALCIATLIIYFNAFTPAGVTTVAYPLEEKVKEYNPYVQQFDAFMKGQLHIDYKPSKSFLRLENPYDPEQRAGRTFLYDRAYFEGKYYSYFGTAPIFTLMLPYYWLTGALPSDGTMQLVFMLIYAIFMTLLVFNLTERVSKKAHPTLLALISYAATVCSLQFLFARGNTPFYYIAATSSMAFLSVFAYLFFKGIFAKKRCARITLFTLSGLAFALCFHSRVNTAFAAAFFIVPVVVFGIILKKRNEAPVLTYDVAANGRFARVRAFCKRHSVADVSLELGSLALFVIVGFVLAFIYNYARFGSIFDFGAKYQLTVLDVSTYKLDITEFGYAIFHYFLSPLSENKTTGALNLGYVGSSVGRALYVDGHFGILNVPFMWTAFATPFIFFDKKRSRTLKYGTLCALVGSFVIAWVDFCLGGVIYRYLCDFSAIFAVLAAIGLTLIIDKTLCTKKAVLKYAVVVMAVLFILISLYIVFRIMAINNINLLPLDESSLFRRIFG